MSAVWDLLPSSKSASSTTWARPPDLLAPSSCASSTQSGVGGAYDVTVDNLDAFLFAVLHTVPDCTSRLQFPGLKARTVNSITRTLLPCLVVPPAQFAQSYSVAIPTSRLLWDLVPEMSSSGISRTAIYRCIQKCWKQSALCIGFQGQVIRQQLRQGAPKFCTWSEDPTAAGCKQYRGSEEPREHAPHAHVCLWGYH